MIGFVELIAQRSVLINASSKVLRPVIVASSSLNNHQLVRHASNNKAWDKKWRKFRTLKTIKVDIPDFREAESAQDYTPNEIRQKMKERGMQPARPWMERPYEISSTSEIFEPYVPPEGEGKASYISTEGAKQTAEMVSKKSRSWMTFRKIRSFDEDFETKDFAKEAEKIYLDVHQAVAAKDKHLIRTLVTEKAYPEVTHNMKLRTIHWKFIESIEPPRIVHARHTDMITKENIFAQVTCRFFTKQSLAVYDRFGRLAHGSEVVAKDVLEYVVFEKHLSDQYGTWRVHGKIIPEWAPSNFETSFKTMRMDPEDGQPCGPEKPSSDDLIKRRIAGIMVA